MSRSPHSPRKDAPLVPTAVEQAAMDLYAARLRRTQAWEGLARFREEHGGCLTWMDHPGGAPCFSHFAPDEENLWCTVCAASQPLFLAYKKEGGAVGAAMRRLMHLCEKIQG